MSRLPLQPNLKSYRGSTENLRRKIDAYNVMAQTVVDHINSLIANDPTEVQQYSFASIALDLRLTADQVRSAISGSEGGGISFRVSEADRQALARYKSKSG